MLHATGNDFYGVYEAGFRRVRARTAIGRDKNRKWSPTEFNLVLGDCGKAGNDIASEWALSEGGMDVLRRLFEKRFGIPAEQVDALQGKLGGSGRTIVRLRGGGMSAIGIVYSVLEENVAFLEFSRHFWAHGLPVPEIYAEDLNEGAYLEEDLGDTTLFEFLSDNRAGEQVSPNAVEAYRKVVAELPRFQVEAGRDLNYKVCYPRASFDRQSIAWDLNYFKYYFLRLSGISFNEQAL